MKWEKLKVADVCELAYGKSLTADSRIPGDYPVYGSAGEVGTHINFLIDGPGIIIGRKGSVGTIYYEKRNFYPIDTSYYVIPKQGNDLRFLYYKFQTLGLNRLNSDAAVPGLNRNVVYEQSSIYPPLPTQRRIASILSAYDDLIENNIKRIKLLEEKAFLRYKQIVREEKMEKIKLEEVAVLNEESLKSNSNLDKLLYVDIASVSTGSIDNKTEFDTKEAPGRAKRILKHQDIIWSCVRPNRKSYSFVWKPEENLIASTGFAVITAQEIPATFLYQLVTTNEFVNYLENHAKGATYPAVTASDFEEAIIQIASDSIMKEYNDEAYQCFELKHVLQKQNTKLREARDILLPRLMNGEIEV